MLPVHFGTRLVGRIEAERPGLSFTYAPEWLEWPNAFAISVTMPLVEAVHSSGVATPWFANLLPEDRQLERIATLLRRDGGDVYGVLEAIGRDVAGALSIGGPPSDGPGRYRALDEAQLAETIARLPQQPMLAGSQGVSMSLAGAQSKIGVRVMDGAIALPLDGAASTHILKPASDRLYALVENELLCLRLAAAIGLPAASATMGRAGDTSYLLVERYDRFPSGAEAVRRGHQEDFCQALGLYPTQKYQAGGGPSFADLFATIDRHARRPASDRLRLLDLAIFACCIGDTDRHAKNHALILADDGPRLAPAYDLVCALAYDGITTNLAMRIGGQNRADHIERRHWHRFARAVGLAPSATVQRAVSLATSVMARVEEVAQTVTASTPAKSDAVALFAERIADRARVVAASATRGDSDSGVSESGV